MDEIPDKNKDEENMATQLEYKTEFLNKVETLSNEQRKTIIQFLYERADGEDKAAVKRIVEKMTRANRENHMNKEDAEQLKKEIEARLINWQNKDEEELWIEVIIEEDYDDWYDDEDDEELYLDFAPGLLSSIENLLMDAETAARQHWWDLALQIIQAIYEAPIEVSGEDWDNWNCLSGLECLVEYEWHENHLYNTVEVLLLQLLKEQQMETSKKVERMKTLVEISESKPFILNDLLKMDPSIQISTEFIEAWLKEVMPSDEFIEDEKVNVFSEAISLYEKRKNGEELVWMYASYAPGIYERYYNEHVIERSAKQKTQYIDAVLNKDELDESYKVNLLDKLVSVYEETNQFELAQKAGIEAFSYCPTYRRYKKLVQIDPDQNYLSLFPSKWKKKFGNDAWLIEALEGQTKGLIKNLNDKNKIDIRKELTVLLGMLCQGETDNRSLKELIQRFLSEDPYYSIFIYHEKMDNAIPVHALLFARAFKQAKWNKKDIQQLLNLALQCIDGYTRYILSSQIRKEYFRCAQLIGATKYALQILGESNAFDILYQRYSYELRRYPKFKEEFYIWVR